MTMPRFTAEAALCRTRKQYRNGVQVNTLPTTTIGLIYPAKDEVIEVHSCPPGWTDIGGTCWPDPLTEPSGGGWDPGTSFGNGEGGEPRGGGGATPSKRRPKRPSNKPPKKPTGPHNHQDNCTDEQYASERAQYCHKQRDKDMDNDVPFEKWHYLVCEGSKMDCCQNYGDDIIICDEL